jgi:endoglucanase
MSGIMTENTADAGGGKDVGSINYGDWMDYSVNVSTSGSYPVNLRVATPYGGAKFQIKSSNGTVLATVDVPTTGSWQTWRTVTANISLAAGTQTIRVQSVASAGWNFNWMEITNGANSATMQKTLSTTTATTQTTLETTALDIYPNPVVDRFVLQINNELTGTVNVQIYNMQGAVAKQFSLSKTDAASSQFYLSIGELAAANYIVKVTMNGWTDSKQISKQ